MTLNTMLSMIGGQAAGLLLVALSVTPTFGAAAPWQSDRAKRAGNPLIITALGSEGKPRSFLGVGVQEVDAERARERNLSEERGVEITSVVDDSAADKAGLEKGDVVLEYNGQRVEGVEQFVRLVKETPSGRQVALRVSRDGSVETLTATIGVCEKCGYSFGGWGEKVIRIPDVKMPDIRIPDIPRRFTTWRSPRLGIEAESLKSQLAVYFGVEEGVLVRSVINNSAAEEAGLKAGDVIVKVGDTEVSSPREVSSAIREMESATFPVTIVREKREMSLPVNLESIPGGEGRLRDIHHPGSGTRL